jgi:hypothetical protein
MAQATREKYAGSELATAIAILAIVAGVAAAIGWWSLRSAEQAKSAALTEEVVTQVADGYLATPFDLALHLNQYQSVRDSQALSESPDQRQLFAVGTQRTAMMINRSAQIYEAARLSPDGAEPFIRKNIGLQEAEIAAIANKQGASIPAGSPAHQGVMADLAELELWYRALSAIQTNRTIPPASTDLQSLTAK